MRNKVRSNPKPGGDRCGKSLADGGRPMIKCDSENLLDIALLEIAEGLLSYEFPDENETAETVEKIQ